MEHQFKTAGVLTRVFVSGCCKHSSSILVGMGRLNGKNLQAWCYQDTNSGKTWCTKRVADQTEGQIIIFSRVISKNLELLCTHDFLIQSTEFFQILNSGAFYMCGLQDLEVLQPRGFFSSRFISKWGSWRAFWKWFFLKVCSQQWF